MKSECYKVLCINLESTASPWSPFTAVNHFQMFMQTGGPWELHSVLSHPLLTWHSKTSSISVGGTQSRIGDGQCLPPQEHVESFMTKLTSHEEYVCSEDYHYQLWLFSIDLFQPSLMIKVLTGKDHSVDPKFLWQYLIFSNIQHKNSLASCQFNLLALDKWELPESEALRPTNQLLNQAWTFHGICLLVASFSWIQGLVEVCGDSASRWELHKCLPNSRVDPNTLGDLGTFPQLPGSSPSHHPRPQQAAKWKETFGFYFFFLKK